MIKGDRNLAIRQHLYSVGYSSVQSIAAAVGVSLATIRRDLQTLESDGFIIRDHGGARIAERAGVEVAFELREQQNLKSKRAIADVAYDMIKPKSTIFLDAGTTVYQLARRIRLNPIPLSVFSNCISIAQELVDVEGVSVTLLGGRLRKENASLVGGLTEDALDGLWFESLFLGAGAIADDCCIYSLDPDEARVNAKMISRAGNRTLLVDSTKFGQRLSYKVASLADNINVVTDSGLGSGWVSTLRELGCRPLFAAPNPIEAKETGATS